MTKAGDVKGVSDHGDATLFAKLRSDQSAMVRLVELIGVEREVGDEDGVVNGHEFGVTKVTRTAELPTGATGEVASVRRFVRATERGLRTSHCSNDRVITAASFQE